MSILYFRQENGGKHRAMNKGIELASGQLFFSVDSDDTLSNDAVEKVIQAWNIHGSHENLLGLCFRRGDPDTNLMLGTPFKKDVSFASPQKINYLWRKYCDKAEVFRTDVIKRNRFPVIEGEKFLTECVWIFSIARKPHRDMVCLNDVIRFTKYYDDGLTRNYEAVKNQNPKGYIQYYKILLATPYCWLHPHFILRVIHQLFNLNWHLKNCNKAI